MRSVVFDQKGICIDGEYRTLLASSLFYFRIPQERWEERMKLLKAAGYHAIDVYFPWNYHETAPGSWDFDGNRDVERFLKLAADNELFVIARPGPYICSEWDGGAIPAWLWEKGIAIRQDDPDFLQEIGNWYRHILPILAKYQIGKGGTVICMQIENELDFYNCISPVSYMAKLKRQAEELGMEVPLFYCCGQNDLLRGGGLTPGLYTAFNVYEDGGSPNLEERGFHLYTSVQERNMPFLITETNREHGFLKRLLACGARLLSPYNQTAGATMDFYNGITNWGTTENPVALMASDYDFNSMIGSAGEVNRQFLEARLLSGLLYSLKGSLAAATPEKAHGLRLVSAQTVNTLLPILYLPEGGLVAVSNLGDAGAVTLESELRQEESVVLRIEMEEKETRLLPWHFQVNGACEIRYSNYEIGWIDQCGERTEIGLYGSGPLECLLVGGHGQEKICYDDTVQTVSFVYGDVVFTAGSLETMGAGHIPGLPDLVLGIAEQRRTGELSGLYVSPCLLKQGETRPETIKPMERMGQYRGIGRYHVTIPETGEYLLSKAADLITVDDGHSARSFYSNGGCSLHHFSEGELNIFTEIWGHSNFDDIRCASLRMGSLKGIEKLVRIVSKEEISAGWLMDMDEMPWEDTFFFRHSPYNTICGIDGYNRALSPLKTVYTRYIESGSGEDALFLHFEKADCIIGIYVNNRYVGMIQKDDPYLDLSSFAGSGRMELTVRIIRRYYADLAGRVTLLRGQRIRDCQYGTVLPAPGKDGETCTLPFRMEQGENRFLLLSLEQGSAKDIKLFLKGKDMKLTVYAGGHTAGRILLPQEDMPVVAGGRRDVVYLCREWVEKEAVQIWCQGTGRHPVLEEIAVEEYTSVV